MAKRECFECGKPVEEDEADWWGELALHPECYDKALSEPLDSQTPDEIPWYRREPGEG